MPRPEDFSCAVIFTGPTGSGKSAMALELAERWNAEIVAMDSMTLYRDMDIGTAKPGASERARVPHHLIDVLDPSEPASVAWWLEQAARRTEEIESRGKLPLFVGGTPLYLKAILYGLFDGPQADPQIRARLEREAHAGGPESLHHRLRRLDPVSADRLHPHDVRRVIRALEVLELTGKPISIWQTEWRAPSAPGSSRATVYCVDWPREPLYERINARVLAMLEAGWLEEVRRLLARTPPACREAMAAVGYRELAAYCRNPEHWDDVVARIQQKTRNYAKRQLTWFRNMPECRFVPPELTSWVTRSTMTCVPMR